MKTAQVMTEKLIKLFATCMMSVVVFMISVALFRSDSGAEASIGTFEDITFNTGWQLEHSGTVMDIELPSDIIVGKNETAIIKNTLPDYIADGMNMMYRSNMQDVEIYIDGSLREKYLSEELDINQYYQPSAYIITELHDEDAGKLIEIHVTNKNGASLSEARIGYGNNSWFLVIQNNIALVVIAIMVLIIGIVTVIAVVFMQKSVNISGAASSLGLLMIDMSFYILSESRLRQLLFKSPSLSAYFSFLSLELLSLFACFYFDEVQHRRYHRRYLAIEILASLQLIINIILNITGIAELYKTLLFSHLWMLVALLLLSVNIIQDIKSHYIKNYICITIGIIIFIMMSMIELIQFYVNKTHSFGASLCGGMIVLMTCTILQVVMDERKNSELREKQQTTMVVSTIETIASSIDAKDEYTGGHSERVGRYAGILAREMAADYDLSEEDILRIRYIGLLHDIGKIGVDDSVLNKAGKLTDEEFSLMKKHVEIGYELMGALGDEITGLLEGIRNHHERFDGRGYPDGLAGTDIPLVARILCLADCYDAMTSNRVYRKRLTDEEVKAEILRCSGTQFDPALSEIFVKLIDRGDLKPNTIEGMEVSADGTIPKSSLLENRLQHELLEGIELLNPGHVRMLCYIAKLLEKKNHDVRIYFANPVIKETLGRRDINIEYTAEKNVVALIDKSEEKVAAFESAVKNSGSGYILEELI